MYNLESQKLSVIPSLQRLLRDLLLISLDFVLCIY